MYHRRVSATRRAGDGGDDVNGVPATETLYTGGGGRRSSKQAQWMGLTARIAAVVTLSAGRLLLGCDFTGDKPALVSIVRGATGIGTFYVITCRTRRHGEPLRSHSATRVLKYIFASMYRNLSVPALHAPQMPRRQLSRFVEMVPGWVAARRRVGLHRLHRHRHLP